MALRRWIRQSPVMPNGTDKILFASITKIGIHICQNAIVINVDYFIISHAHKFPKIIRNGPMPYIVFSVMVMGWVCLNVLEVHGIGMAVANEPGNGKSRPAGRLGVRINVLKYQGIVHRTSAIILRITSG